MYTFSALYNINPLHPCRCLGGIVCIHWNPLENESVGVDHYRRCLLCEMKRSCRGCCDSTKKSNFFLPLDLDERMQCAITPSLHRPVEEDEMQGCKWVCDRGCPPCNRYVNFWSLGAGLRQPPSHSLRSVIQLRIVCELKHPCRID
jgi:hypothetical protein